MLIIPTSLVALKTLLCFIEKDLGTKEMMETSSKKLKFFVDILDAKFFCFLIGYSFNRVLKFTDSLCRSSRRIGKRERERRGRRWRGDGF